MARHFTVRCPDATLTMEDLDAHLASLRRELVAVRAALAKREAPIRAPLIEKNAELAPLRTRIAALMAQRAKIDVELATIDRPRGPMFWQLARYGRVSLYVMVIVGGIATLPNRAPQGFAVAAGLLLAAIAWGFRDD